MNIDASSESRKTSVEVTTQDGDKVTIGLSLTQQQQSSTSFAQGDGQSSFAFSHQQICNSLLRQVSRKMQTNIN